MTSIDTSYGVSLRKNGAVSSKPVTQITKAILALGTSMAALNDTESVLNSAVINNTYDAIDAEQVNTNLILPSIFDRNTSQKVAVKKSI